ncbi:hypothetical protein FSARC_6656 [Fusarium sarcochroum]|uniref:3-beta hydroxysteroid dehydrogenase/isomerase domain-containing protein n=1 Tax=Fusarium sarcochroum TaxID=1208366 RepID=A0A8H4TWT3_9HYPO|nr:hypothetical protein FSARC_6656 [Fusarium sarcochroum]
MTQTATPEWGTILLLGGSGRLGHYVAQELLRQPEQKTIISLNRSESVKHPCPGVEYRQVDLCNSTALRQVMLETRPTAIFNLAAPAHANTLTPKSEFEQVFVHAQDLILELAKEVSTKYLVTATSANVAAGDEHIDVDETARLWPIDSTAFAYWVQRAEAERRLLAADCTELQTVSLRLPLIIGEMDYAFVPAVIKTLREGKAAVQVGNDTGLIATIPASEAARAHILALRRLMEADNNAHGEAFYITGKYPLSFWSMCHIVWKEAGWEEKTPTIMPRWLAQAIATVTETVMRPFGMEPTLSSHTIKFTCNTFTYNGAKAKERLGFLPELDIEEELRKSTRWSLKYEST